MGLICTNLANELGHHLVVAVYVLEKWELASGYVKIAIEKWP